MQNLLSNVTKERPQTHDFIKSILDGLEVSPIQFVIHDFKDDIYYGRLFLRRFIGNDRQIVEIDVRPSDGLIISLMYNSPILCTSQLLKKIQQS